MTFVVCPKCGNENEPEANFCSSCGEPLNEELPTTVGMEPVEGVLGELEVEGEIAPGEAGNALAALVVKRGPNQGERYWLETKEVSVGRHPDSDIFLDDITVSRHHARFTWDGETHVVEDVGSLNGTYVNRERIEKARLSHGDEVQIGKFKLVYAVPGHK